jgi:hypothetical protein
MAARGARAAERPVRRVGMLVTTAADDPEGQARLAAFVQGLQAGDGSAQSGTNRPSGEWNEDDFDVLANGAVVGRIFKANASPVRASWMWTLAFGHDEDRMPTHGYAETREAAMSAFAKSWRCE